MKMEYKEVEPNIWEISKSGLMRVPARVFGTKGILEQALQDSSLVQLTNVATLPGIQNYSLVMPDVHEGYGFPIGGVAAMDLEEGVISPGGIGYDINCGVRILKSDFEYDEIKNYLKKISEQIYKEVPSGVGKSGIIKLSIKELNNVLDNGCKWAIKEGFAERNDLEYIENNGYLPEANSDFVSDKAKERGYRQLGTIGAGNHFIEINRITEIFDESTAHQFGISLNQIVIQIHTGSRGLGHQVATDYIKLMLKKALQYNFTLPDRELACVPIKSEDGQNYLSAMSAAANFAWVNRQVITYELRKAWGKIFGNNKNLSVLYDVAHNIAKIEEHKIGSQYKSVLVHRKGATRAFPPNHKQIPKKYRQIGQPVLIPGSMGTESYILVGKEKSMELSFGSACHGAGRTLSRTKARKSINSEELFNELTNKGIRIQTGSLRGLSEEAPDAYKNVSEVVEVIQTLGIANKIAKLKPLAVIKG